MSEFSLEHIHKYLIEVRFTDDRCDIEKHKKSDSKLMLSDFVEVGED